MLFTVESILHFDSLLPFCVKGGPTLAANASVSKRIALQQLGLGGNNDKENMGNWTTAAAAKASAPMVSPAGSKPRKSQRNYYNHGRESPRVPRQDFDLQRQQQEACKGEESTD